MLRGGGVKAGVKLVVRLSDFCFEPPFGNWDLGVIGGRQNPAGLTQNVSVQTLPGGMLWSSL